MHFMKRMLLSFHMNQRGSLKQRLEIILVGLAVAGILFTAIVIYSGGTFLQITTQPVNQNVAQFDTKPGSALSGIVNPNIIPDSVTQDLSGLKDKIKIPPTDIIIENDTSGQPVNSQVQ